jgi:hypothetical protein
LLARAGLHRRCHLWPLHPPPGRALGPSNLCAGIRQTLPRGHKLYEPQFYGVQESIGVCVVTVGKVRTAAGTGHHFEQARRLLVIH